jgi:hypothetical protein
MSGKRHSEETRKRMSISAAGRKPSSNAIARTIETRTGKPLSESTRKKMREAQLRRWARIKESQES